VGLHRGGTCAASAPLFFLRLDNPKSRNVLNVLIVGSSTVSSRVAGLFRDMLMFGILGRSVYCSAFLYAFTLPNLFRRLLGEGALTSALIPVMARELDEKGKPGFYSLLNKVLSRVAVVLFVSVAVGCAGMWLARGYFPDGGKWDLLLKYGTFLFPFLVMICLSAVIGGALNSLGKFGAVALTPLALNLCMIFSMAVLANFLGDNLDEKVQWLCAGVLAGGLLQFAMPAWALWKSGWKPVADFQDSPEIQCAWKLFVPGVAGASVLQVNLLVSRTLSFSLEDSAVALLFLASRLVELPLGIFTIAVTTVIFPQIAKLQVQKEHDRFHSTFQKGLLWILVLTIPAAVGLGVLAGPILDFLFNWGLFDDSAVQDTIPILQISAAGLPFYSAVAMYTRGFHAQQDMHRPLRGSVHVLIANLALSLLLMKFYGVYGLAVAGVLSSVYQCVYLHHFFHPGKSSILNADLAKVVVSAALMGLVCHALWKFESQYLGSGKQASFLYILNLIPVGIGSYLAFLWLSRFSEFDVIARKFLLKIFARRS
jgi:putative peptidoglycan lipid II flippase